MRRTPEIALAGLIAVLAALRVLAFTAAFPFFTSIDEPMHVDAVLKYARGYLPHPVGDDYEPQMAVLYGNYATPEYHMRESVRAAQGVPDPVWRRSAEDLEYQIEDMREYFGRRRNLEAYQAPLYYGVAAIWLHLGRALGIEGGQLLYWLRSLNALLFSALVFGSYLFLRREYPDDAVIRIGVPLLLAAFPQDALYYVAPDAISPLLCGVAFFLVVRFVRHPECSAATYAAVGALTAAAYLAKYTNLVALVPCVLATVWLLASRPGARSLRGEGGKLLILWLLALGPIAGWSLRNERLFGDPMATSAKLERMGWEQKPVAEWADHPLFSVAGPLEFVSHLAPTFWRGELAWHRQILAWDSADRAYTLSSLLFVLFSAAALLRRGAAFRTESLALATLAAFIGMLAILSLMFRFPRLGNPSSAFPYFVQGRLIAGAMVPFLILYLRGIRVATDLLPQSARTAAAWSCVAAIAVIIAVSEIVSTAPVFSSQYNWYHLP